MATTGAVAPQPSVPPLEVADELPTFAPAESARLWVVGAHGGAGESTMACLLDGMSAGHRWPRSESLPAVLLTARTHARGLEAAQLAMRSWASGQTPSVRMLGLVLIADAPGRMPKQLANRAHVLAGGVPHVWHLPWIEDFRLGHVAATQHRRVRKALDEINTVLSTSH